MIAAMPMTSQNPAPASRCHPQTVVLILLGVATVLKLQWAFGSEGSADAHLFYFFGRALQKMSLANLYAKLPLFNHTPAMGVWVSFLFRVCNGDFQSFATAFRFVPILSDIGVVLGLLHIRRLTGQPPWWALGLFAISPVSIMISGFHASPDPVMVLCLFYASIAAFHERPIWCGLLFCLACNIKAMAILLAPLYFFFWFPRGSAATLRFTVAAGLGLLIGSAWPLLICPGPYLQHVLGYGGYWGWWGIPYWLKQTGVSALQKPDFQGLSPEQTAIMTALKFVIISCILAVAWIRRKCEPKDFFATIAIAFVFLFVFASGGGVHYMVWYAPFLLLLNPRWWAALTAASTIFIFAFYQIGAKGEWFPWNASTIPPDKIGAASAWTNLPWLVFIAFLICESPSWFRSKASVEPMQAPKTAPCA